MVSVEQAYLFCSYRDVPATEQLFTYKLGGRKATRSGKSPTHSRHFAQVG